MTLVLTLGNPINQAQLCYYPPMLKAHDQSYKLLFSEPEEVINHLIEWLATPEQTRLRRRFGHPVAEQVQATIMLIQDTDHLEQIGDWIVDCTDGGEFLSEFSRRYPT